MVFENGKSILGFGRVREGGGANPPPPLPLPFETMELPELCVGRKVVLLLLGGGGGLGEEEEEEKLLLALLLLREARLGVEAEFC